MIFSIDKATYNDIVNHFANCSLEYLHEIEQKILLKNYISKIEKNAKTFELWEQGCLIGLIAIYINRGINYPAFITNVSIITSYHHQGLSKVLIEELMKFLRNMQFHSVLLEVRKDNLIAKSLYSKYGFKKKDEASEISEFWEKKL